MSGYVQGPDGRFLGSIGAGKAGVPTPSDLPGPGSAAPADGSGGGEVAAVWTSYLRRRDRIDADGSARELDAARDRLHAVLDQAEASEDDVREAWNWYVEHDTTGYRVREGVRDLGPRVLAHRNCPPEVLDESVICPLDTNLGWAVAAATHPNATPAIIDAAAAATLEAAEDPRRDAEMTAGVSRPTVFALASLPGDLLAEASASPSSQVRLDVASNPSTPHQVARTMAMRERDSYVIAALRRRFRRAGDEDSLLLLRPRAGA